MIADPLKIFVTVVEHKNFSRAAEELYLSQPSVSLQIRNLENELGTKLINRSPKHLELTQSGEIFYGYAKQILHLHDKAKQEIDQLTNVVTGALKVGASYTIGEYILPFVLAEFAAQFPNVDIEASIANTEEMIQAVRANHLDLALVEGEVNYSDLDIRPIMEDEIILVVPNQHALARLPVVTAEHLQDQVWILREGGSGTRAFSDKLIKDWGINVKKTYIFGSGQAVKQAVMAGLGIALVSSWIVRKELNAQELTEIKIQGKRLTRSFSLINPKNHEMSKAMEVFTEQLFSHDLLT
ncbi:selenium metabolism-associated LysR family transcriptional regulator [Desulfosporosinus sp. Sb-LF]|uniref:selenium metabolism-associated LysR family transcriptional regulator n=1 Tax=Desulfosporosinus sp. Sb-LF TaxID=2560027 RepID=UPI00107F8E8D|nr:selenium metabolism-associated LysR family transcriptional regulator [Desulfosporosinus sp. Sb-LF]TGE32919.1 LysR family transcriptional regulator [Desulfosporosinus sp. Sb-LF]